MNRRFGYQDISTTASFSGNYPSASVRRFLNMKALRYVSRHFLLREGKSKSLSIVQNRQTSLTRLSAGGGRRGPVPPTHTQRKELSARRSLKTVSVNMMCQDVTSCNVFKNICNVLKIFDAFEIKTRPR